MTKPSIKPLKIGLEALQKAQTKRKTWQRTFDEMFENGVVNLKFMDDLEAGMIDLLKSVYQDSDVIERWVYTYNYGQNLPNPSEQTEKKISPFNQRKKCTIIF